MPTQSSGVRPSSVPRGPGARAGGWAPELDVREPRRRRAAPHPRESRRRRGGHGGARGAPGGGSRRAVPTAPSASRCPARLCATAAGDGVCGQVVRVLPEFAGREAQSGGTLDPASRAPRALSRARTAGAPAAVGKQLVPAPLALRLSPEPAGSGRGQNFCDPHGGINRKRRAPSPAALPLLCGLRGAAQRTPPGTPAGPPGARRAP